MHRKYGPIVRISPREIHIDTPEFYDTVYSRNGKREIWGVSRVGFGVDVSTVVTVDHDLHRKRRGAMIPMFAQQRIYALQHIIRERVGALMSRLRQAGEVEETLNMKLGYAAFTAGEVSPIRDPTMLADVENRRGHAVLLWQTPEQS